MIEQLFVQFGGLVLQQTIGISIGMNYVPLLAVLFRHAYEAQFCQGFLKNKNRTKLLFQLSLYRLFCQDVDYTIDTLETSASYLDLVHCLQLQW